MREVALKTFNLDKDVYGEFSRHCKNNGISMSKKIENFIKEELVRMKVEKIDFKEAKSSEKKLEHHPMGKYC